MRVSRDDVAYYYQAGSEATPEVESGAQVVFQTHDARAGALDGYEPGIPFDLPLRSPIGRSNPLSGPVSVRGAEVGDTLLVRVDDIVVAGRGWCGGRPIVGLEAGRIPNALARVCSVEDSYVRFTEEIAIKANPMIGCIGTAPAGERIPSEHPGRNGGNMDQKVIHAGSVVHLPVAHRGAYLYIGDVHAAQGDGELSGIGLEIAAEVTVTLDVVKGTGITWPWVEADDRIMVLVSAPNFPQARRYAMESMLTVVESQLQLGPEDALALISIVGDIRIGQACGGMDMTVRLEMPASLGLHPA